MNSVFCEDIKFSPSKIVCVGRNYAEHAKELGNPVPSEIVFFIKPNSAISSSLIAFHGECLHYELELCLIVKNNQYHAVGLGLDLTKRALQTELKKMSLPWERAKAFDGSAVLSHFTLLRAPLETISFELLVDDNIRQHGRVDQMIFSPKAILSEVNSFLSLQDGDVIMTGTPKGVGPIVVGEHFCARLFSNNKLILESSWTAQ